MHKKEINICDECGSEYLKSKSEMKTLCPECANILYGYEKCQHVFKNGRCSKCFWNGKQSGFITSLLN